MRKLMTTVLMAAVAIPSLAVPGIASAQSWREVERSRRDVREERRELRQAQRYGDRRDVRREQRDVRDARRDLRQDRRDYRWGRNDWRDWRNRNGALYARGNWRAPFRYNRWRPGVRIAPVYYGQRYWINDPYRYHLPPVRGNQRWVRHYDDVLLIDRRRGVVVDVISGFWR
ncbi:RcnB family protein [Sphingomonas sp.]|uniref:RcnB family protein n=1 Tax=Sphingomonas sp. TaxID=28214 RepID=UPI002BCA1A78|nr:RcnB family protein [Sphingomonas sp.]HTG39270.1 RcnB family protein [Sphingomonas sp.]